MSYQVPCLILFLFLIPNISAASECVTYNFEEDFDSVFTNGIAPCSPGHDAWTLGNYDTRPSIERPNPNSNYFISPNISISCTTSFKFHMSGSGVLELHVFMESVQIQDFVQVMITDEDSGGVAAFIFFTPISPNFVQGWNTLRLEMFGNDYFSGYVTFVGSAQENSIVLIDSFRYIPPHYDDEQCVIYTEETEESEEEVVPPPIESEESVEEAPLPTESEESVEEVPPSTESKETDHPPSDSDESGEVNLPPLESIESFNYWRLIAIILIVLILIVMIICFIRFFCCKIGKKKKITVTKNTGRRV